MKLKPSEEKKQALMSLLSGKADCESGDNFLSELILRSTEHVLQELLEAEQAEFLGRENYQRGGEQGIYRNGYETGTLKSSEGMMQVKLPQVRGLDQPYQSSLWRTLGRTSEHLQALVTELYSNGLSTRDIEYSLEQALGQFMLSKSSVSVITERLLEQYEVFKARDLSGFDIAYVFMDVVFEPLRRYGSRLGVMVCWGQCTDGSRVLLDLTLANNESYEATLEFLHGMIRRGLPTPLSCTTDGAPGLIKAVESAWPRAKRIRCWFHKMQNLQQKVPPEAWPEIKAMIEDMRDAPDEKQGQSRLKYCLDQLKKEFPEAYRCLRDDSQASLNHLHFPKRHRQFIRTTNFVERCFVEERRRTKVIPHLWDEQSLTKLVFSVLIRASDRWSKRRFSEMEQRQLEQFKQQWFENLNKPQQKVTKATRRSASRAA